MPKEPVQIDLPDLSTTDQKKKSHSDFYIKDADNLENEPKSEEEQKSLITTKLEELSKNI